MDLFALHRPHTRAHFYTLSFPQLLSHPNMRPRAPSPALPHPTPPHTQVFQACKLLNDALLAARGTTRRPSSTPASSASSSASSAPEPVREAAALLGQSLLARYGRLRGPHLGRLTQAALRTSRDFF